MEQVDKRQLLSSRVFFYQLFAKMLFLEPTAAFLQPLATDERITAILQEDTLSEDEKNFFTVLQSMQQYKPADWNLLHAEYMRLFADPAHIVVCPWESVYLSREHVIFDEHTLAVQDFYQHWGMAAPNRTAGPADHIGIECSFLAYLSEIAIDCPTQMDLQKNLFAQRLFLKNHLCLFIEKFCQTLDKESSHAFYQSLSNFLYSYITTDAAILDEILETESCKEDKNNEF